MAPVKTTRVHAHAPTGEHIGWFDIPNSVMRWNEDWQLQVTANPESFVPDKEGCAP